MLNDMYPNNVIKACLFMHKIAQSCIMNVRLIAHCLSHGYLRNSAVLFVHYFFASWPLVLLKDQKQVLYGTTLNTIKKETQVNARSRLSKVMKKRNVTGQLEGHKKSN